MDVELAVIVVVEVEVVVVIVDVEERLLLLNHATIEWSPYICLMK